MTLRFTTSRAIGAAIVLTLGSAASASAQTTGTAGTPDTMGSMQDSTRRSTPSSARRTRGTAVRKDATMGGMDVQKDVAPAPAPEPAPLPPPAPEPVPAPLPPAPEPVPAPAPEPVVTTTTTTTVTETPAARFGNGFYVGVGGGANFPQNAEFNQFYEAGPSANLQLGFDPQTSPIGLRLNLGYNRLNGQELTNQTIGGIQYTGQYASSNLYSAMLDAKLRLPFGRLFGATSGLYAVGGGGVAYFQDYQRFQQTTGVPVGGATAGTFRAEDVTRFAANGGVGLDFGIGPASLFAEGRYVRVFTQDRATSYIPVTIGLRFHTR